MPAFNKYIAVMAPWLLRGWGLGASIASAMFAIAKISIMSFTTDV